MKKVASIMAVAFLFALNVNAQEIKKTKKAAKAKAKTEKSCTTTETAEKKACATGEKKAGGCCAHKS